MSQAARAFRVLVVGGAGVFGGRLVDAILASTDWQVVVAGRDAARIDRFIEPRCATVGPSRLSAAILDASCCTAADIAAVGVDAVVDTAGPFQTAGYALAQAVIAAGCHYVDIADARRFVGGFGAALDEAARSTGVVALTGASSTPALSNAVLDDLTRDWSRIDDITVCISPGNKTPRGLSVVRAILSYAGRPLRLFRHGGWTHAPGWGLTRRVAMPGLGRRWLSLCDTPDLDILAERFRPRRSAVFLAGLELPVLHLGLAAAALAVRAGVLPSLAPLARLAHAVAVRFERFGTDRGGMLVEAAGRDGSGRAVHARWSLVAHHGDGPSVPILPALAALRAIADGRLHEAGARPCVGLFGLGEIEAELARYRITTARSVTRLAPDVHAQNDDRPVPSSRAAASAAWRPRCW